MKCLVHFGTVSDANPAVDNLASVKQVHSGVMVSVNSPGVHGEADGLITDRPGLVLGIKTADCLPILMAERNGGAIAAVHAGWRGTAQEIGSVAVLKMKTDFGIEPQDLDVWFGPAIGPCCFQVGPEVAHRFGQYNPSYAGASGKVLLDLIAINVAQLEKVGVRADRMTFADECTFCLAGKYHSFRRQGAEAGRMWSSIQMTAG